MVLVNSKASKRLPIIYYKEAWKMTVWTQIARVQFAQLRYICIISKGQSISKGLFGILELFQKTNERIRF